ncbi:MAG TPA: NmrA family NAD(P)-binding protein [Myxococcales bacterium]|jgi:nucleoside-diphosphate-sugar epimerase|nr:NmrA family NAD(P)-binding protein [Myxococcales bacterium]
MSQENRTVLVAGAGGRLGSLIVEALRARHYPVRVLSRPGRAAPPVAGIERVEGDLSDPASLDRALAGSAAVVSAVNGGEDVAVAGQKNLLAAAKRQGVGRFIPSDYSVDYFKLEYGDNVFLDYRKRVAEAVEQSGVGHSFVLIGGFIDIMLTRGAFDLANGRVNIWGTGDEPYAVTTIEDTARLVAEVVFDPRAHNRKVAFAGDTVTTRGVAEEYARLSGKRLQENRLGSVDDLARWIAEKKKTATSPLEYVFGQYAWAQLSGKAALTDLVNGWYPDLKPTTVRDVLRQMLAPPARS